MPRVAGPCPVGSFCLPSAGCAASRAGERARDGQAAGRGVALRVLHRRLPHHGGPREVRILRWLSEEQKYKISDDQNALPLDVLGCASKVVTPRRLGAMPQVIPNSPSNRTIHYTRCRLLPRSSINVCDARTPQQRVERQYTWSVLQRRLTQDGPYAWQRP